MTAPVMARIRRALQRDTADPQTRELIRSELIAQALPSFEYYLLTFIATLTATFGLLADSTAVIIGAMLLAPLMGPIFGIALGIAEGDEQLLWKAFRGEVYGVLLAIGIALLIGLAPFRPEFGANILARTQPTIYDLMIAFAAGLGGAMGLVNRRILASLPGVAIAVALLPPLATTGLCLADGWWAGAGGAFLLFFANLLAIAFMATLVFLVTGLVEPREQAVNPHHLPRSLILTITLILAVGVFLTQTLRDIVSTQQQEHQIRAAILAQLTQLPGTELDAIRIESNAEHLEVAAVLVTTEPLTPEAIQELETGMVARLRRPVSLLVRSLIAQDADKEGPVYLNPDLSARSAAAQADSQRLQRLTRVLREALTQVPGAELGQVSWIPGPPLEVTAHVRTPEAIGPAQVLTMQQALIEDQQEELRLIVRSSITRSADAEHFLYDPGSELPPSAQLIQRTILESARDQLLLLDSRFELKEARYGQLGDRLRVLLRVAGPVVLTPDQVQEIESGFRRDVSAAIDLAIQVSVGAEVTPTGIDSDPLTDFMEGTLSEEAITALPAPPLAAILPEDNDAEAP